MDASSATTAAHRPGRGRVFDSIVDTVGDSPERYLSTALFEGI
jgi:cysteine synthase